MLTAAPDQNCSASLPGQENIAWKGKHPYTAEDIAKAKGFLKSHIMPWIKLQLDVRRQNSQRTERGGRSNYKYPVLDSVNNAGGDLMDESQWIPSAFAMAQSRARARAIIDSSYCGPMQMIIHGEGGAAKAG
ncbi:unnamed protein product [Phytophthora lilii]|uniref:Unnamed protein product n=1 Tax=Phytophthora lilii TaxID=2077276 RepID=A0A9W7CUP8_9STRA|nr:unnamed protein product [Phytophthora lilii]